MKNITGIGLTLGASCWLALIFLIVKSFSCLDRGMSCQEGDLFLSAFFGLVISAPAIMVGLIASYKRVK